MLEKKLNNSKGITLIEIMVGTLIATIVLTALTSIYYFTSRASNKGFERSEAQQSMNKAMDSILKDLRTVGADVDTSSCGMEKQDAIGAAEPTGMVLYGNFYQDNDFAPSAVRTPTIERVEYSIENDICLIRQVYEQTAPGTNTWETTPYKETILIGNRPTGKSRIRIAADNGFELLYLDTLQTPIPNPLPSPRPALTAGERRIIRRVNITITITDPDNDSHLAYGMNSTGMLRNLQRNQ